MAQAARHLRRLRLDGVYALRGQVTQRASSTRRPALDAALQQELDALAAQQLRRVCRILEPTTGPVIRYDGREFLHFASNDYLGLARDPRVIRAAQQALERYGLGSGASRLMSGTSPLHQQCEERLAAFKRQDAALVFSSGYLANLGLITSLVGPGDVIYCDHANHASLIDAARLSRATLRVYDHGDAAHLRELLAVGQAARQRLVISDGVFSMDGDVAPLAALAATAEAHEAWLLIDDAHGCFVLGEHGRGSVEAAGIEDRVPLQMGTLSKALGALGGYVAGSHALIDWLIQRARAFIYSTALPPAVLAGALAALDIVEREPERRQRVAALSSRLRSGLRAQGWDTLQSVTHIVPVVLGSNARTLQAMQQLLADGIYAPAVRPPTVPRGLGRVRLSVTAAHSEAHIDRCLEAMARVRRALGD